MHIPCPFRGESLAAAMAVSRTFRNFAQVRGVKPEFEQYMKRGTAAGGSFMHR